MSFLTAVKQYIKQLWEDSPSTNTALEAMRLNHMEDGIDNNDTRIVDLENAPKAHKIVNKTGTEMTARPNLQFTGIADVSDNNPSDKTIVNIPSSLSAYTNDTNFITNTVNNLTNYYLKSETYTQAEVNALISGIIGLNILVVQTLPTQDISTTTIYLVPKQTPETQDVYDEYIYVNNAWEHIGSTEIDLSNYYTKTQTDNLLANKVDKVTGKQLSTEDFTSVLKTKLDGIANGAEVNVQPDWSQSDSTQEDFIKNKPQNLVSDASYVHTDNNYTTTEKNKLAGIATGAEANVQSDWNQTDNQQDDFIKNKPTNVSDFTNDSGFITGVDVEDIGDVDLSNLANGQVLKYNSTSQKWENANESGGGATYTEGDGIDISQQNVISVDTAFTEASTRTNIASGDTLATIWGKIKKFFSDLKTVAFSGNSSDLNNDAGFITGEDKCKGVAYKPILDTADKLDNFREANTFQCALWNGWSSADKAKASYPGIENGIALSGAWSDTTFGFQIAIDDDPSYFIALRQRGQGGWNAWKKIPLADGTNASGTWGIDISGNANYANSAGSATDSTKLPLAGGTMTGTINCPTDTANVPAIRFRGDTNWMSYVVHETSGDEATIFATNKAQTSFMFVNGESQANISASRWLSLVPTLQMKYGCVSIGKLIANGVNPTHKLDVAGTIHASNNVVIDSDKGVRIGSQTKITDLGSNSTLCLCGNDISCRKITDTNAYTVIYAQAFTVMSSRLVKKNIQPISEEEAVKILALNVVEFDYIEEVGGEKDQFGIIAEEVLDILPSIVNVPDNYDEEDTKHNLKTGQFAKTISLDYSKFVPHLIKMVQMQQKEIDELKEAVKALQKGE